MSSSATLLKYNNYTSVTWRLMTLLRDFLDNFFSIRDFLDNFVSIRKKIVQKVA